MKIHWRLLLTICLFVQDMPLLAQPTIPKYYKESRSLSASLKNILKEAGLDSSYDAGEDGLLKVSIAVIDLRSNKPVFGGVNHNQFIYPASVYKMYVAMEVLKQVSRGEYSLYRNYVVRTPNDVDRSKEISFDSRPLLKNGDTVTIRYLLDLMITRSDNTAANCLIDIAGRKRINQTMKEYGWEGSEVTRKFLKRSVEDPGYDTVRSTVTCALHAADFMYRIYKGQLVNNRVSNEMKLLLGAQLDTTKLATGLPSTMMFYHKTGWWSMYTHDVGWAEDESSKFVIAVFMPLKEAEAIPKMKLIAEKISRLMERRIR
jgi:beta-lactamase class A